MPTVGSTISEICKYTRKGSLYEKLLKLTNKEFHFNIIKIDIKAEMLRRCYGTKAPEN
jgi:hypothetical protein